MSNEEVAARRRMLLLPRRSRYRVISLLKGQFDIRETDGDLGVRDKVKRNLKLFQVDEIATLPYFLELISVKDSGIDRIPLSPEGETRPFRP